MTYAAGAASIRDSYFTAGAIGGSFRFAAARAAPTATRRRLHTFPTSPTSQRE